MKTGKEMTFKQAVLSGRNDPDRTIKITNRDEKRYGVFSGRRMVCDAFVQKEA